MTSRSGLILPTLSSGLTLGESIVHLDREQTIKSSGLASDLHNIVLDREQTLQAKAFQKANRNFLHRLVESTGFTAIAAILIVTNGIMIGVETDNDFEAMGGGWQIFGISQEYFFSCAFAFELCLKLTVYKKGFFHGEESSWNIVDFMIVAVDCIDRILTALMSSGESADMRQMSALRLLRLVRVIRLFRVFRIVKPLWLFIKGIISACGISCYGMMLTTFLVYLGAIFCTRQLRDEAAQDFKIRELFGTVASSMFTLFQIATGDSWAEMVARPVAKYQPSMIVFFIFFICIAQFGCLNVIVAIIVESVLKQAIKTDQELAKEAEGELRQALHDIYDIFAEMDVDGDGMLTKEEFDQGLKNPNVKYLLQKIEISFEDAKEMFEIVDVDSSGTVDLHEFVQGFLQGRGQAQAKDLLSVQNNMTGMRREVNSSFREVLKLLKRVDENSHLLHKLVDENRTLKQSPDSCLSGLLDDEFSHAPPDNKNGSSNNNINNHGPLQPAMHIPFLQESESDVVSFKKLSQDASCLAAGLAAQLHITSAGYESYTSANSEQFSILRQMSAQLSMMQRQLEVLPKPTPHHSHHSSAIHGLKFEISEVSGKIPTNSSGGGSPIIQSQPTALPKGSCAGLPACHTGLWSAKDSAMGG